MEFNEYLKNRRSVYKLSNAMVVANEVIEKKIQEMLLATPSAFNSESQTVALLFGKEHERLWEIVKEELKKIVPVVDFPKTETKINGFLSARGTVLFFDDQKITKGLMKRFPLYKHNFKIWYQQQNGMLQSNIWVALSFLGLGASLQHYSELIEQKLKEEFSIPKSWELLAQMPFGKPLEKPEAKPKRNLAERFIVKK